MSWNRAGLRDSGGDFVAGRIVDAGGSFLQSGVIGVGGPLGTVKIGGNIQGDPSHLAYVTAGGFNALPGAPAIKSLTVKGSVVSGSILAGYNQDFTARNLNAGIGSVRICGNLEASFIIAGADKVPTTSLGILTTSP